MTIECGEITNVVVGTHHHQVVPRILIILSIRIMLYSKIGPVSFHEHPVTLT